MLFAGLDIGAVATKVIITDEHDKIVCSNIMRTGSSSKTGSEAIFRETVAKIGKKIKDLNYVVSTGYGRGNTPFTQSQVTEITCHAKGAFFSFPNTRTIIDIGGQDSKTILINDAGDVIDFAMNDKCAAGTGRFLEVMAGVLEVSIEQLGNLSLRSKNEIAISSMCTVFAESEVVSLIAEGCPREDIAMAVHNSVADRVIGLANKLKMVKYVTLSGGVINNIGVIHALKKRLGLDVNIPKAPQLMGALGAALLAKERSGLVRDIK
jgi:(R)-2-hydroxyacyl-CoA dehydratese activating ATPase